MYSRFLERALAVVAGCALAWCAGAQAADTGRVLRVCAHPDNLPFSAQDESGFDNRIARVVANALPAKLEFTWLEPQHGLVRKTLGAGLCDAIFGLPEGYEGAALTRPYYRSRYVFISPRGAAPALSFASEALKTERVGVQVIGDDMAATPPGYALARAGVRHVVGFPVYGERPAVARMTDAVARGELDAAVAWGPAAGYYAARAARPLRVTPASAPEELAWLPFEFDVGVAVRKDDRALKSAIESALVAHRTEIDAILRAYDVPRADL